MGSENVSAAVLEALHQVNAFQSVLIGHSGSGDPGHALNSLVQSFEALREAGGSCDVVLPADVVSDVDLGRNPAAYVARCAEETTIANQATKGRIQAFAELQTTLLDLRNHVQK